MGVCFSKKKSKSKSNGEEELQLSPLNRVKPKLGGGGGAGEAGADDSSRDPPPTEEEEKVKEMLSEVPKPVIRSSTSNSTAKAGNNNYSDDDDDDDDDGRDVQRSEASVTTLISSTVPEKGKGKGKDKDKDKDKDKARAKEEEEEVKMNKTKTMTMRSTTARSPAKARDHQDLFRANGSNIYRGLDIGCRSARSSPLKGREASSRTRLPPAASTTASATSRGNNNGKVTNNKKRGGDHSSSSRRDEGEEKSHAGSGRRSLSPALDRSSASRTHRRNCSGDDQRRRVPAGPSRVDARGQDGNIATGGNRNGNCNGNEADAKESLENPLVSLECFIFI